MPESPLSRRNAGRAASYGRVSPVERFPVPYSEEAIALQARHRSLDPIMNHSTESIALQARHRSLDPIVNYSDEAMAYQLRHQSLDPGFNYGDEAVVNSARHRSLDLIQAATEMRTSYSSLATLTNNPHNSFRPLYPYELDEKHHYSSRTSSRPISRDGYADSMAQSYKEYGVGATSSVVNFLQPSIASGAATPEQDPELAPPPPPVPQGPSFSTFHELAFIINLCLAQFLSLATLAQTVAPLLIIGDSLGVHDLGQLSWFTAAFSLTVGTFLLPSGKMR